MRQGQQRRSCPSSQLRTVCLRSNAYILRNQCVFIDTFNASASIVESSRALFCDFVSTRFSLSFILFHVKHMTDFICPSAGLDQALSQRKPSSPPVGLELSFVPAAEARRECHTQDLVKRFLSIARLLSGSDLYSLCEYYL